MALGLGMISLFYACICCTSSVGSGSTHGATWSYIAAIPGGLPGDGAQPPWASHRSNERLHSEISPEAGPCSSGTATPSACTRGDLATQTTRTNPAMPRARWLSHPGSRLLAMTSAHQVVAAYWAAAEARDWTRF